ncbi:hypothetical protein A8L50_22500 [Pantoea ananatis]|uniref:hypothetical protein n=2 Tax=Erwiniaceae TaxID=1903409 RepID=UPI0015774C7D|nr:hypothetical protein [Pantoea ananatis]NQE77549.1 hypothetical protein [Pantoea ananatis]NQE82092.1 hypothetical protein [Pantoea ananatis]
MLNSPEAWLRTCVACALSAAFSLTLSGCSVFSDAGKHRKPDGTAVPPPALYRNVSGETSAREDSGGALLIRCRQELKALITVSPAAASPLSHTFTSMMQKMNQYAGFRDTLSPPLQETMDALYRYRVNRLCADIRHSLLNSLSEQAGQVQE